MKMHYLTGCLRIMPVLAGILIVTACSKMFDIKPEDALDESQNYQDVFDADAAIIGVYGKFMNLAKQHVLLNELRGDLMDVTGISDPYLTELSEHRTTEMNPYADPRPFYEVILNCNDVLHHFNIMLDEKKLSIAEYNQRYSDIGAIRSWVYLQLGIHYGKVPYVTTPLQTQEDLQHIDELPRLPFDVLLDSLLTFTKALPWRADYSTTTSLQTVVDGYNLQNYRERNLSTA